MLRLSPAFIHACYGWLYQETKFPPQPEGPRIILRLSPAFIHACYGWLYQDSKLQLTELSRLLALRKLFSNEQTALDEEHFVFSRSNNI
jgi:hypothetical protein